MPHLTTNSRLQEMWSRLPGTPGLGLGVRHLLESNIFVIIFISSPTVLVFNPPYPHPFILTSYPTLGRTC